MIAAGPAAPGPAAAAARAEPPLAEIAEGAALGPTAEAYAALRRLLDLERVPLLYRHLATVAGGLDAAVAAARVARRDGLLRAAQDAAAGLRLPVTPLLPEEAFAVVGVERPDLERAAALLASYARSNLANLVVVALVRAGSEGVRRGAEPPVAVDPHGAPVPSEESATPRPAPTPALADLAPAARRLVEKLAGHYGLPAGIVPSMYRDLAAWPGVLAVCAALVIAGLEPRDADDAAASLRRRVQRQVAAVAAVPCGDVPAETLDAFARATSTQYALGQWLLPALRAAGGPGGPPLAGRHGS